jgi:hypothetical protein
MDYPMMFALAVFISPMTNYGIMMLYEQNLSSLELKKAPDVKICDRKQALV